MDDRPRTITYIRKRDGLRALQKRPWDAQDFLWWTSTECQLLTYADPPHDAYSEATQLLLDLTPPANCIIGGDFYAKHSLWEPGVVQPRNQGNNIAKWAATHRLAYIGEVGVATYASGHVLDLTFSNIPFATADIMDSLRPGADHEGMLSKVPPQRPPICEQHRLSVPDDKLEAFTQLVTMGAASIQFPLHRPLNQFPPFLSPKDA